MTAKQRKTERFAKLIEQMVGTNSASKDLRAANRRVEKRKRAQYRAQAEHTR